MSAEQIVPGRCLQRAYLWLEKDHGLQPPFSDADLDRMAFDPDEVTEVVGLRPTAAHRRGDLSPRGRPYRMSGWEFGLPELRAFESEKVVVPLLDAVEPFSAGILAACETLGMAAGINVVVTMYGPGVSTAAIGYTARTLRRLVRLGLSVGHDQYIDLPD